MNNTNAFGFDQQWYQLWLQQSTQFFETANSHLSPLFSQQKPFNPDNHHQQIQQWLAALKQQWQFALSTLAPHQQPYATILTNLYNSAADTLQSTWQQRVQNDNPINNVRELYELWLDVCQTEYKKALQSDAIQSAYSEMINATLKLWK